MQMVSYLWVFLFLAGLLLTACTTIVEKEIPFPDRNIVVNSIFSNDSLFKVQLSLPQGIGNFGQGKKFETIENAKVEIFKGGSLLETLPHIGNGVYRSPTLKASYPGAGYSVRVAAPGFPEASATDTLPAPPDTGTLTGTRFYDGENGDGYEISLSLRDDPQQNDYYFVFAYYMDVFSATADTIYFANPLDLELSDPIEEFHIGNQHGFSDKTFNGRSYNLRIKVYNRAAEQFYIVVGKDSPSLYEYYKSYDRQRNEDSPFTPPYEVTNNIENGLGIFGGYASVKYPITLK